MKKNELSEIEKESIINEYNPKFPLSFLLKKYDRKKWRNIKIFLERSGFELLGKPKHKDLEPFKEEILKLYLEQKRGKLYIAKLFSTNDGTVSYHFKKWKVKLWTKSELCKIRSQIYPQSSGFKGKSHSDETKNKIKNSLLDSYAENKRVPHITKSKTFNTKFGRFQGSYEIAYYKKLLLEKSSLPKKSITRIKTPFGSYFPDFEFEDKFIEIKSVFTYKVMIGEEKGFDGEYNIRSQKNKIDWVNKNLKPVEVIVLSNEDAKKYFKLEIESPEFLLDKVKIKNNKYEIS